MRAKGLPRPSGADQKWQDWANALVDALEARETDYGVGMIGEFENLPAGWLPANGSTFSANSHPELKRALGGTVLPNLSPVYDDSHEVGIKA